MPAGGRQQRHDQEQVANPLDHEVIIVREVITSSAIRNAGKRGYWQAPRPHRSIHTMVPEGSKSNSFSRSGSARCVQPLLAGSPMLLWLPVP